VKIKLDPRRNSGLVICASIIIGLLVIMVGAMLVIILVKVCDKCLPPKQTNEAPQLRLESPLLNPPVRAFTIPAGAIQVQRSTDLTHPNWVTISYATIVTNGDLIQVTIYDSAGNVVNTATASAGQRSVTNEVFDMDAIWPKAFYRAAQPATP
jgi:preprotein translocase subunit Sec61beta